MASAVSFLAPAKLNLSLQVFGKRSDGYHHIRSVMVPVSLYDEVTVEEAPAGICVECDAPGVPTDAANSCHKAAALFLAWAGTPAGVRIRIRKTIPAESGLGGGKFRRGGGAERVDRPDREAPSPGSVAGDGGPRRGGRPVLPAGRGGARRGDRRAAHPAPVERSVSRGHRAPRLRAFDAGGVRAARARTGRPPSSWSRPVVPDVFGGGGRRPERFRGRVGTLASGDRRDQAGT